MQYVRSAFQEEGMRLVASGITLCGKWHNSINLPNEDAILVDEARGMFAAVDGVSTKPRGDAASRLVVEALTAITETEPNRACFENAFTNAEDAIEAFKDAEDLLAYPKACVTAVWLREGTGGYHIGFIGHAGDTTALLVNHTTEAIEQLTTPHHVWDGRQFAVNRYIGGRKMTPNFAAVVIPPNCTLLLVTDGVTKKLHMQEICTQALHAASVQELTHTLARMALLAKEADDISVVAVRTLRF